ncbi:MAG TPA: hypothetical protein VHY84_23340 [Bryobacteraceae bacterium]|nr:hypothetical protein [Bryobacteraceae bacterium]
MTVFDLIFLLVLLATAVTLVMAAISAIRWRGIQALKFLRTRGITTIQIQ